jgi:hypothetical protein
METSESLRAEVFGWLDKAEQDAQSVLKEFPEVRFSEEIEQALKSFPHVSDEPVKENLIEYVHEWFIERFEKGETPESLQPEDLQLYLELEKGLNALILLEANTSARDHVRNPDGDLTVLGGMYLAGFLHGCMHADGIATHPGTMRAWRSLTSRLDRKRGHEEDASTRLSLLADFEEYARTRIAEGYQGSAEGMVRHALNRQEFSALKSATTPRKDENRQSTKRAFIKRRRLVEIASKLLRNTPQD